MATVNKIKVVEGNIATALSALAAATGKPFIQFTRTLLDPMSAVNVPALSLLWNSLRRVGGPVGKRTYVLELLVQVLTRNAANNCDDAISDLLIEIDDALETLANAGTAGGVIDQPRWESWHDLRFEPLSACGAACILQVQIQGPLRTTT
jgi:hypothetical protein